MRNCLGKYAGAGPCTGPAILQCGSCGATNYCSICHQMAHWKAHRDECSRMAEQMTRAIVLHDFPFSYAKETTQLVDVGAVTSCSFLEDRNLHRRGLWRGECDCAGPGESFLAGLEWQLPSRMCPCTDPAVSAQCDITDWISYYNWRNLPLDSPVALLLHWPLTLYHAFCLISMRNPTLDNERDCHIHYLGPEKELNMLQTFGELLALFPSRHVHIDMIGPGVPASRDEEVVELSTFSKCLDEDCRCKIGNGEDSNSRGRVTITLWRGLYHDRYSDLGISPHFILAPNAGVAAFSSWQPTISLISKSKVPAIFTDYCEEAAYLAVQSISPAYSEAPTYPIQVNPFRQPLCPGDKQLNLPTYSNCFTFGIN